MGRRTNKFSKAIKHIKSTEIDDKLAMLEAAPTNNTMGYMSTGVHGLPKPDITKTFNAFPTLPLPDFDQDDPSENGRDTSGLFNPSGVHAEGTKILVEEPPGDTSYILGPMAAMYYTWSYPWTMIGYIRESDRKVVNLARIDGKLSDWDGVSGFNNSWWGGQLTLEQAVWFRDVKKYGNVDNDPANANYRAFYPGPPSNSPDAFGRYYCTTTGEYKNRDQTDVVPDPGRTEPDPNSISPDEVLAAIMDRIRKRAKLSNKEKQWLWDNDLGYLLPPDQRNDQGSFDADGNYIPPGFENAISTDQINKTPNNPDTVNAAVGHGLSKERAESMSADELNRFVQQQDSLQADIDKFSKQQKEYEREARNIAIGFGVDVVTTLFGGPILKGAFKGISLGIKGIKALTTTKKVAKVASAIQKTEKISKAAATAKATSLVNKANKVNQSATKTNNAIKAAKTSQKANIVKTNQLPKQPLTYKGPANVKSGTGVGSRRTFNFPKPVKGSSTTKVTTGSGTKPFKPGPLTGKHPTTGKPLKVSPQTPTGKTGFKPGPLTGKHPTTGKPLKVGSQTPVPPKTTGTAKVTTGTGASKTTGITQKVPKNQIPKKGANGKYDINDLNIKDAKGNVTAKVVKNPKTGEWERISRPGKGASTSDLAKWEKLEGQVSNKAWDAYTKTGLLNPSPIGNPLSAMNPFTPQGLRSGPTALAKKFGIPAGIGVGVGAYKGTEAIMKGIESFNPEDAKKFVSNIKGGIENIVSKSPSVEQATNGAIQLVSQVLPQDMRTPARMFLGYLSGSIKGNAGDIVPEADQESAWKGMKISGDGVTVGGPMVNVFGGEPLKNLKVDGDNAVFEFNFAPKTNKVEFAGAPKGRWSPGYQNILTKLGPVTEYMADLSPNFGKTTTDKAIGVGAGGVTNLFKQIDKITPDGSKLLGGIKTARDLNGSIKIPLTKLKTLNRDAYNHLNKSKSIKESYIFNPLSQGIVLTESRKSILKNLKKPVVLPKEPKKFKVKPKLRTPNKWMGSTPKISKPTETPKEYKQIGGRNLWGKAEYNYNVTQSQERMNQVYELVGDGNMAFDYMLTDSKKLNDEQMEKFWGKNPDFYSYFYGGKKYKLVRKEAMDGDFLVFLVDDHGEKSNILQSELNEKLAEEQEMKELEEYNKMNPKQEPVSFEKDYMFKKAYQKLKPQVDYKGKPAKKGYPEDPPPEMVNNRHPDFGKAPGYYNKLDPHSAAAMPQQDNPEIDAKAKDAKENPKKDSAMFRRKLDDKMKKERERLAKEEWEKSDWRKELEGII